MGTSWASGSWEDDTWAAGSWEGTVTPEPEETYAGKYADEHATAFAAIGRATANGFARQHATALRMITRAGR